MYEPTMRNLFRVATMIAMIASALGQKPRVTETRFYDKYGAEISLAYTGGHVVIKCEDPCQAGTKFRLLHNNKEVASGDCEHDRWAQIRLNITETTPFGEYKCKYKDEESDANDGWKFNYRICGQNDKRDGSTCNVNEVCIVTEKEIKTCGTPDLGWCDSQHEREKRVCGPGFRAESLCHAIADGRNALAEGDPCDANRPETPRITYDSDPKKLADAFQIHAKDIQIAVHCPRATNAKVDCILTRSTGTVVDNHTAATCGSSKDFPLPNATFAGSDVFKYECTLWRQQPAYNGRLLVYLVHIDVVGVKLECSTTKDNEGYVAEIECKVDPAPPPVFTVTYKIKPPIGEATEAPKVHVSENGEYKASAKVSYLHDGQSQPIAGDLALTSINVTANPKATPPLPVGEPNATTPPSPSSTPSSSGWVPIVIGVVVVLVALVAGAVLGFVCWRKKGKSKVKLIPAPQALAVLKEKDAMDKEQLKKHVAKLGMVPPGSEEACYIGEKFSDAEDERDDKEEKAGGVLILKNCRFSDGDFGKVNKKSQVVLKDPHVSDPRCLHMSEIPSFYIGLSIFVSQAPLSDMIFYQCQAYLEKKVGVIVVVGRQYEGRSEELITPYWETETGKMTQCKETGKGAVARVIQLRTVSVTKKPGYTVHGIDFGHKGQKPVQVQLAHLEAWPDNEAPERLSELCKLAVHLKEMQEAQAERGLPGIAMHCAAGVQRSVALLNIFLNMLAYLHCGRVNPMGFLRYIRRYRRGAFSTRLVLPRKLFGQYRTICHGVFLLAHWTDKELKTVAAIEAAEAAENVKMLNVSKRSKPSNRNVDESGYVELGPASQVGRPMVGVSALRSGIKKSQVGRPTVGLSALKSGVKKSVMPSARGMSSVNARSRKK